MMKNKMNKIDERNTKVGETKKKKTRKQRKTK